MQERAKEVRKLHENMGHPSDVRLKETITQGIIIFLSPYSQICG
jgi:hypothetical protein